MNSEGHQGSCPHISVTVSCDDGDTSSVYTETWYGRKLSGRAALAAVVTCRGDFVTSVANLADFINELFFHDEFVLLDDDERDVEGIQQWAASVIERNSRKKDERGV